MLCPRPAAKNCFSTLPAGHVLNDLDKAIIFFRKSEILVVWKLDRMGCSITHLIEMIQMVQ